MGFLYMRILVFIFVLIISIGLQSCNSTVKSVYRDDFRSASKTEVKNIQEEVGASNSNKSILILTQTYKGEKIIISQNGKDIFSEYPITNLKSRIANYFSVNTNFDVLVKDVSTKKEIVIPAKRIIKHKYVYLMKKLSIIVVTVIATLFIYVYPIRSYYTQKAEENIEQQRLAVLVEANAKMKEERKSLSTDEKIEQIAREQYRLVKPGEEAYIVSGQEPAVPKTAP